MTHWLITGVSTGLGMALAKAALARGDKVAGTVRKPADRAAFEALAPGLALGVLLDVTDEAALRAAVDAAEAAFGGLDVLVNNAGYGLTGAVEEASLAEIRALFEVNTFAPIVATQAVLPYFRARRAGRVINVSSVSGVAVWAGTGVYTASKFALEGVMQTLAQEVAPFGIKVTNLEPGGMRTDYAGRSLRKPARTIADYGEGPAHQAAIILADHAGQEPGDPEAIARIVLGVADMDDPPLQLLLGADAMLYASQKVSVFQAEMGRWVKLTMASGFDEG
jgi:NAD(P)-dependent dehydrogenase (short-subunit alcohol dehydrogenase family)